MNDQTEAQAGSGMSLGDLLYILFRHKWKIVFVFALALAAALSLVLVIPQTYESQAKLYVRSVPEPEPPIPLVPEPGRPRLPEKSPEALMNTEVEIFYNLNLAQEVVTTVGLDKILGPRADSAETNKAAVALLNGLSIEVPKNTTVMQIRFKHTRAEIVQPVLQQFIEAYRTKHLESHAFEQVDDSLTREVDRLRMRVQQTKDELRKAKGRLGVTSLEEAKRACAERDSTLRQQLSDAEAELAAQQARIRELTNESVTPPPALTNSSLLASNVIQAPPEKVAEYRTVCRMIERLTASEQEFLGIYTRSNPIVREVQTRLAENEQLKKALEAEYPSLLAGRTNESSPVAAAAGMSLQPDLVSERVRLSAAMARVEKLTGNLARVRQETSDLIEAESGITELEARSATEEAQYKRFDDRLEQLRMEARMGGGRVLHIFRLQPPSPPLRAASKLWTMMALVLLGGVGAAVGLAMLIELYLDPTVKRAQDVGRLRLPLFLSVPLLDGNGSAPALRAKDAAPPVQIGEGSGQPAGEGRSDAAVLAPWDEKHELGAYSGALRDRVMTWFEHRQMTHKPKLVALTSCGKGAGVSTFAAGLAASMSETGEGKVLLVDMNAQNGAAHQFRRGGLDCGLDEVLEDGKRENAQVLEKLYVVSEGPNSERLPGVLPKRFQSLVPKLKASDYDYIIFDLPPVSQVSLTPRLSRFMDLVLVVVESEQTGREVVRQACALLSETEANVGVVLNKRRKYVPRSLMQEI